MQQPTESDTTPPKGLSPWECFTPDCTLNGTNIRAVTW